MLVGLNFAHDIYNDMLWNFNFGSFFVTDEQPLRGMEY